MASQVMRITLKAYDHELVDSSAKKIIETVKKNGSQVSGPVPLPTKKEVVTILRAVSPCVSFDFLPHTPSLDGLLNLYSDLSSVFKLDIRSTENLPSLWQQPRASLLSCHSSLSISERA